MCIKYIIDSDDDCPNGINFFLKKKILYVFCMFKGMYSLNDLKKMKSPAYVAGNTT
jgi:hypothetical protein